MKKEITLERRDVVALYQACESMKNAAVNPELSYAVGRTQRSVRPDYESILEVSQLTLKIYNEERNKIIDSCAKVNDKGKVVYGAKGGKSLDSNKLQEFESSIIALDLKHKDTLDKNLKFEKEKVTITVYTYKPRLGDIEKTPIDLCDIIEEVTPEEKK